MFFSVLPSGLGPSNRTTTCSPPFHAPLNVVRTHIQVAIKKMKKKFYTWEECMQLREVKVGSSAL